MEKVIKPLTEEELKIREEKAKNNSPVEGLRTFLKK